MIKLTRRSMLLGSAATLAACASGGASKFRTYTGPEVTGVIAYKQTRTLHLLHGQRPLKTYTFEMGFAPDGHKRQEGDGRTPEGQYWINRRNPNSRYHLSVGISYPNATDRALAHAAGVPPGGDIFIHGTPTNFLGVTDWTVGCIAVTNPEIEEIYSMVRDGTPIWIVANPDTVLEAPTEPAEIVGVTAEDPQSASGAELAAEAPESAAAPSATPDPAQAGSPQQPSAETQAAPLSAEPPSTSPASVPVRTGATLRPRARP